MIVAESTYEASPVKVVLPPKGAKEGSRLTFLDWTRGLAVAIMLQGHVFHSFTRTDLRGSGPYVFSQFFGGIGPAVFLVLTGITLGFLMHRRERQGLPMSQRWVAALRRSGYLFLLAFLFRLQLWTFAFGQSPWTDLLKVDVLNCMGLAIAVLSVMAFFSTAERVKMSFALGLLIAAASPIISGLDWKGVPAPIANYLVPNYNYFSFFPWAAFIAFGLSIGSIIRLTPPEQMNRLMQWAGLSGFGLVLGGQYFSQFPASVYPKSEFWLDSPWLVIIKLGVVLLVLSFAYLWSEYALQGRWSWIRQLGTTSLLVYWVHIELVYGRWFGWLKENMTTPQVVAASALLILAMLGLSVLRTRWSTLRFTSLLAPYPHPGRVSGD